MAPTLRPGSLVVGVRARKIRPGHVVIVRHEGVEKIKRVKDIRLGEVFLTGDNALHSTDSRDFGWLDMGSVVARVAWPVRLSHRQILKS